MLNTTAPVAPTAAASVGAAMPAKMLPNTARIRSAAGTSAVSRSQSFSPSVASISEGSSPGPASRWIAQRPTI